MRIIGLAGWSGAGKTTLLAKVIPLIVARGLTVSTLKHAHHSFDLDQPGKDSHTHRAAGATEVLIASANRYALMHELRGAPEPSLHELLAKLSPVDLVVVEGFKAARYRKLEIFRAAVGKPALHLEDPLIVGIVSDTPFPAGARPVVSIDDAEAVVGLMLDHAEPIAQVLARAPAPPQQRRA
jgi:molybdopterin-guanine dinucleotide biosynthesis protein B